MSLDLHTYTNVEMCSFSIYPFSILNQVGQIFANWIIVLFFLLIFSHFYLFTQLKILQIIYSNRNDIIYFAILLHSWSGQLYNFNMYGSSITTYKITFLYIFNSCIKAQHTNRVTMIYPYDMNLNGLKQGVSFELSKFYLAK